jgi:hypothetical protein
VTRRGATRSDGRRDNGAASVVELALDGLTAREIATRLSVHRSTVWRQLTDPLNRARLDQLTALRIAANEQRIAQMGEQALDLVEQLLTDEAAPPAVRLRAAQLVLERTLPVLPVTVKAEVGPAPHQGVETAALLARIAASVEAGRHTDAGPTC